MTNTEFEDENEHSSRCTLTWLSAAVNVCLSIAQIGIGIHAKLQRLVADFVLAIVKRIKSRMLIAHAWHARSDAASSFVVGVGIIGTLAGYPILEPIAALIVGPMILKMGRGFAWDTLHDLMDRAVDEIGRRAIGETLLTTPGISGVHDVCTRKAALEKAG